MVKGHPVDVVVLTAIALEYEAVLKVDAGAVDVPGWRTEPLNGLPVAYRSYEGRGGQPLRFAVARAPDMGMVAALTVLSPLVEALQPQCIAMSGVCAGRPGETRLGDVLVGERLFGYDGGKRTVVGTQQDIATYSLRRDWKVAFEHFRPIDRFGGEAWWRERPIDLEWQENWALSVLRKGISDVGEMPDLSICCPQWSHVIEELWRRGDVDQGTLRLTTQGRERIDRQLIRSRSLPDRSPAGPDMPFSIHVAPIGSGNQVVEDERVWGYISDHMRKTLGVEMEAAALGALAEGRKHHAPVDALVVKGVMDFANHGRDDQFKDYAARASAECLIAFLRDNLLARSEARAVDVSPIRKEQADSGGRGELSSVAVVGVGPGDVHVVSHYELMSELTSHGSCVNFCARHASLGRMFALKVLKESIFLSDGESASRFLAEGRLVASIRHDNVIDVVDMGTLAGGRPYLVTELLQGKYLSERIRDGLDALTAVDIAEQIARAMVATHAQGFIHADISPSYVFVTAGNRAKIVDYSLAQRVSGVGRSGVAPADFIFGTPAYIAPERIRGLPGVQATDQYSLGVILYEMLVGSPPFEAATVREICILHISEPPPRLSESLGSLPASVEEIVLRCLAKRPEDRFLTMADLAAALSDALGDLRSANSSRRWRGGVTGA